MHYAIDEIEGIGPAYAAKLKQAGIETSEDLLKLCCDAKGRKDVAARTGVSEKLLLEWVNMADLMRISGIGKQYAELLEAAGVDTVKELRNRNPENLAAKMAEVNEQKKLARTTPSVSQVAAWVEAAKKLEPLVTH